MRRKLSIIILIMHVFISCGQYYDGNEGGADQSVVLNTPDSLTILNAILTYRDTLIVSEGEDGIIQTLSHYGNVDTIHFINNEYFQFRPGGLLEIDSKTLRFVEAPFGYPKNHDIQERPDISFTQFELVEDTVHCTLYSLFGNGLWEFKLTQENGHWVVSEYKSARF